MIELFDTSVLVLAARHPGVRAALAEALAADEVALCEPVLLEYLNGARNATEYDRFETGLLAARQVHADNRDWARALDVHRELARSAPGHHRSVRIPDLLIAAVAERHELPVVHYDEDYDRIAAVTGQATRWIVARGVA